MTTSLRYTDLKLYRRLLLEAAPYWPQMAMILVLDLSLTPILLLTPIPLKIAVDNVLGSAPLPILLQILLPEWVAQSSFWLLAFAATLQVLVVLLIQLQSLITYVLRTRTGEGLTLGFRGRLFEHLQRLSFTFHETRGTADSIYRIQYDAPAVQYTTIYGVIPFAAALVTLVSMILVIVQINWSLALVALIASPVLFLLTRSYRVSMRSRYETVKALESDALHVVQEVLTAMRVVKAFGSEGRELRRFVHRSRESALARVLLTHAEGVFGLRVNLVTAIGTAVVLFIGVRNVQSGALTLGELLLVLAYLSELYGPMKAISQRVAGLQSSLASAQRAFELVDRVPELMDRPTARPLARAVGAVEFRNVSFAYDRNQVVLRNVSSVIAPGTRVGIVGRTGAGKSTLVSLLPRFFDPSEGQVLIDGVDARDYKLKDLRSQFAIVLQEPLLFSTTIAENIAYGSPGAGDEQIVRAAKAAQAHDFIIALPDGYQTRVGERGMHLSGGERQRISLARAVLKDAPILILDEPTSSVDLDTEDEILEMIEHLTRGRTSFTISHRLSALNTCDVLLHLEDGRLAIGTFDGQLPGLTVSQRGG